VWSNIGDLPVSRSPIADPARKWRKRRPSREALRPTIVLSRDDLCLTPSSLSVRHLSSATAERPLTRAGPMVRIRFPPADSPSLAGFLLPVSKSRQLPRGARVRPGSTASRDAQGSSTSRQLPVISLSGTNPVPQCRLGALEPGCTAAPRGSDKRCHQALSSVRLRQSRARPSARASQVADANAQAACLRSDRAAGVRRGWLR